MGLPTISVEFKALALTAAARSARGILAVILQDGTKTFDTKSYASLAEVDQSDYTAANYAILSRAFLASPYQVVVVRVASNAAISAATAILDKVAFNWVCSPVSAYQAGLVTYVKGLNTPQRVRKAKALVSGQTSADDMHIVNVSNTTVTLKGASATTPMLEYLPRLGGLLAACPLDESVTFAPLEDLDAVAPVTGPDGAIDGGNLVLISDDDAIRIARGVNTLTTVSGSKTADMKKIAVVEAMDTIQEDIIRTWKTHYLGKRRNTADNQALFVADVNDYLTQLAGEDVLDRQAGISVAVDVAAMRTAWAADGVDVSALSDAKVKAKTYKAKVFITAQARILDAMEDMELSFVMA